jgi:hypothetical protein
MSPHSALLLFALILAVSATAQYDILFSISLNTSTVRLCALDNPNRCVYVPKLNFTADINRTYVVWSHVGYPRAGGLYVHMNYDKLTYVVAGLRLTANIYIPRGFIYASGRFYVNGDTSHTYTVCNMTLNHAYYIESNGYYNVQNAPLPLYWLDLATCTSYVYAQHISFVQNLTRYVYLHIFYMPNATGKGESPSQNLWWLNGREHRYFFTFYSHIAYYSVCIGGYCYDGHHMYIIPMGAGFYARPNTTRIFTAVYYTNSGRWYGPRHISALGELALDSPPSYISAPHGGVAFTMPPPPGDGIVHLHIPVLNVTRQAELVFVQDGYAAYFLINGPYRTWLTNNRFFIYATRYAVAEVAVADSGNIVYATRTVACPAFRSVTTSGNSWLALPIPLNRVYEIEVCNNHTITLYVGIYQMHSTPAAYSYVDEIRPGRCGKLRWDRIYSNTQTQMRIFNSTANFCGGRAWVVVPGSMYYPQRRHYIMRDGSLVAGPFIDPDSHYLNALLELIRLLAQQYNMTLNAFLQRLMQQSNASRTLQDFLNSQPRFQGTIRMNSSTSVWINTLLNELGKWHVPGPPGGGGFSSSPPAPPALTASAAAAAVATAWAASRRSLATAAFLAGFAILATALFTVALYGTAVTAALVTVGVMLMVLGAAAAWMRQTGEE